MFIQFLAESYSKKWYHTTNAEFDTFDVTKSDLGSHFGNKEQANHVNANRRKGSNNTLITANLSIYNPLRLKDVGCFHADCIADQLLKSKIIDKDLHAKFTHKDANRKENNQIVRDRLIKQGYDGIVYRNNHEGKGDSMIAIHPNDITIIKKDKFEGS